MGWEHTARFYRQLAMMARTGMPIGNSLRLAGDAAGRAYRRLGETWAKGCDQGADLASQLQAAGEPALAVALIHAGETTGRLPELSSRVADHFEHVDALRRLAIGKLVYPVVLLHAGLIVPLLPGVIVNDDSPWWLLAGPAALWGAVLGLTLLGRAWHASGFLARLALLPGPSYIVQPFLSCNTCLVLSAAVAAGLGVRPALELAADACGNRVLGARLRTAGIDVERQTLPDLTAGLRQAGLPQALTQLIATGEQSGALDRTLDQAAVAARESFKLRAEWATKAVTGAIYASITVFVAWKIISMYANVMNAGMAAANAD
jgi:type II secretory pathway component PulF